MMPSIRRPVADEPTSESPADACRRYLREFRRSRRAAHPALVMPPICGGAPDDGPIEPPSGFSDTSHVAAKEGFGLLFRYAYGDLRPMIERGAKVLMSRGFTECRAREIVGARLQDIYTAQAKRLEAKTRDFDWWTDRTEELYEQAFNSDRPSFSRFIQDYTGTRTLLLDVERGASTRIQDEQYKFNETARRNQAGSHDPERVRSLIARLRCQATDPTDPPSGFSDTDAEPFRLNADPIKPEPAGKASDRAYAAILANRHPSGPEYDRYRRLSGRLDSARHEAESIVNSWRDSNEVRATRATDQAREKLDLYESRLATLGEWDESIGCPAIQEWDRIARFAAEPTPFPGFPIEPKRPDPTPEPEPEMTLNPDQQRIFDTLRSGMPVRVAPLDGTRKPFTIKPRPFHDYGVIKDGNKRVSKYFRMDNDELSNWISALKPAPEPTPEPEPEPTDPEPTPLPDFRGDTAEHRQQRADRSRAIREARAEVQATGYRDEDAVRRLIDAYYGEPRDSVHWAQLRRVATADMKTRDAKREARKVAAAKGVATRKANTLTHDVPSQDFREPEPALPVFGQHATLDDVRRAYPVGSRVTSDMIPNQTFLVTGHKTRVGGHSQFRSSQHVATLKQEGPIELKGIKHSGHLEFHAEMAGHQIKIESPIRSNEPTATVTIEPGQSGNGADGWLILVTTPDGRTPIREWDATRDGADAYANFARHMIEQGRTPRAIEHGSTWDAPEQTTAATATTDHESHHGPASGLPEPVSAKATGRNTPERTTKARRIAGFRVAARNSRFSPPITRGMMVGRTLAPSDIVEGDIVHIGTSVTSAGAGSWLSGTVVRRIGKTKADVSVVDIVPSGYSATGPDWSPPVPKKEKPRRFDLAPSSSRGVYIQRSSRSGKNIRLHPIILPIDGIHPEPARCCPAGEPVPCMGCRAELTPLPGFSGRPVADHAALALAIDGTDYGLIVSADRQTFTIERRDGKAYEVTNGSRGLTCTCADFIHRRAGLDPSGCKHCRAIRTAGLISAVDEMPARLPSDDVRPPSGVFGRMTVKPTLADRIADTLNPDLPWTIQADDIESIIMSLARDPKAWDQFSDAVNDVAYQIELGEVPAEPVSVPGCFSGD